MDVLVPAFEAWQHWLGASLVALHSAISRLEVMQQALPEVFDSASHQDLVHFQALLQHLSGLVAELPKCLSGVLEFVAGMLCFSCEPQWEQYTNATTLEGVAAYRLSVPSYEVRSVWVRCEESNRKSVATIQAMYKARELMEMACGKEAFKAVEDELGLFSSPASLERSVFAVIADNPLYGAFSRPTSSVQVANELDTSASRGYGAVSAGKASRFEVSWPEAAEDAEKLLQPLEAWSGEGAKKESEFVHREKKHRKVAKRPRSELLPWGLVVLLPLVPALHGVICAWRTPICPGPVEDEETKGTRSKIAQRAAFSYDGDPETAEGQGLLLAEDSDPESEEAVVAPFGGPSSSEHPMDPL